MHTLGNLTITGYNSELSNKSFTEKKQIIEEYSKATILNKDVLDKNIWNSKAIQDRTERLSKIVVERYAITPIKDNDIEFEYTETIDLTNYEKATGKDLSSFIFRNQSYISDTFKLMLIKVLSLLESEKQVSLKELAVQKFRLGKANKGKLVISTQEDDFTTPVEILEGVFVETNLSTKNILRFIKSIFAQYNIEESLFSMHLIAEGENDEEDSDEDISEEEQ